MNISLEELKDIETRAKFIAEVKKITEATEEQLKDPTQAIQDAMNDNSGTIEVQHSLKEIKPIKTA